MSSIMVEIEKGRARRALDEKIIPDDVINRVLKSAVWAPSCFNNQPWRFVAVRSEEVLGRVKENLAGGNYWALRSPCIIAVATTPDNDCRLSDNRDYALFSTGLAAENLILQAIAEGLVAHPIAGFKPVPVKEILGIPEEYILITLIILGYPGDPSQLSEEHQKKENMPRDRKPMHEVVFFDAWEAGEGA